MSAYRDPVTVTRVRWSRIAGQWRIAAADAPPAPASRRTAGAVAAPSIGDSVWHWSELKRPTRGRVTADSPPPRRNLTGARGAVDSFTEQPRWEA